MQFLHSGFLELTNLSAVLLEMTPVLLEAVYLFILINVAVGRYLYMCEKDLVNKAKIICPHPGHIRIDYANYGRTDDFRCRDIAPPLSFAKPSECCVRDRRRYHHFFGTACNGKPECTVFKLERYEEPCKKLDKYLEIRWSCHYTFFKITLSLIGHIFLIIMFACVLMCSYMRCSDQADMMVARGVEVLKQRWTRKEREEEEEAEWVPTQVVRGTDQYQNLDFDDKVQYAALSAKPPSVDKMAPKK